MEESAPQTPKSVNRKREEKMGEYIASKKLILDIVPIALKLARVNPIGKAKSRQIKNRKCIVARSMASMEMATKYFRHWEMK